MRSRDLARTIRNSLPRARVFDHGDQLEVRALIHVDREECEGGGCNVEFSVFIVKRKMELEFGVDGFTEKGLKENAERLPPQCRECLKRELYYWRGMVLKSL